MWQEIIDFFSPPILKEVPLYIRAIPGLTEKINDVIAFGWYSAIIKLSVFTFLAGWFSCFAYVLLLRWIRSVGEAPEPVSNSFAEEDI
jgi:hypothetical protein